MKHKRTRLIRPWLALMLCICMVFPMVGHMAFAAPPEDPVYLDGIKGKDTYTGESAQKPVKTLQKALDLAGEGGTIVVTNMVQLNSGDNVVLENITIRKDDNWTFGYMIAVYQGATLTIGEGAVLDGNNVTALGNEALIRLEEQGSTVNIGPGAVLQNNTQGAISVQMGTLNMTGGTIQNNSGTGVTAGGVTVGGEGALFNMTGGEIINNSSVEGAGGVTASNGTFKMSGGKIQDNASEEGGGGVLLYYCKQAELTGGSIESNEAVYGGGVCILGTCDVLLDGAAISGNSTSGNGGGVYVEQYDTGACTFTVKSGSITGNTAGTEDDGGHGGGIMGYWANGTPAVIDIQGGTISGNTAVGGHGNAVYLSEDFEKADYVRLRLSGSPTISGDVYLETNDALTNKIDVTGNFTPTSPVTIDDYDLTDYRPVVIYAQGLTPDLSMFAAGTRKWNVELYLEGQNISFVKMKKVTIDGFGEFYNLPDRVIDQSKMPQVTKAGYTLTGYKDKNGNPWNMETGLVNADLVLYPVWKLNPATFTLTADKDKVHVTPVTGGEATLTAKVFPHQASNITYTWQWYKDGKLIEEGKNTEVIKVNEPGTYKVVIVADHVPSIVSDPVEDTIVIGAEDHIYPDEWKTDDTNHWKECTVCGNVDGKAQHAGGAATCHEQAECDICEKAYGALNPQNHTGGTEVRDDKDATCTLDGYTGDTYCLGCNAQISSGQTIPAKGHNFGAWEEVTSPNCVDKGSEKRACSACGYTETRDVDPVGHAWEAEFTVDKEASCTQDGSKSIHCEKCDAVKESTVIPATGHSFGEWATVKEATATQPGLREKVCAVCGYKVTEEIPATGSPSVVPPESSHPSNPGAPQTGYDSNLTLTLALLGLSGTGLTLLLVLTRKKAHRARHYRR